MGYKATKKEIDKFREDYARLRLNHKNKEMAQRMDVDPGYLSKCGSTPKDPRKEKSKNPGKGIIEKLYLHYSHELRYAGAVTPKPEDPSQNDENPKNEFLVSEPLPETQEQGKIRHMPASMPQYDGNDPNAEKERLLSIMTDLAQANKYMADSHKLFAHSQDEMATGVRIHAETIKALVLDASSKRKGHNKTSSSE
jgi:hypothetical protein